MTNHLSQLQNDILSQIEQVTDLRSLETLRVQILGKQSELSQLMRALGTLSVDERKVQGQILNQIHQTISHAFSARKENLEAAAFDQQMMCEKLDVTLDAAPQPQGKIHPFSQTLYEAVQIFKKMGFAVAEGPEIEEDFYNFTALNVPEDHPARQEQDTFYLPTQEGTKRVLRTHTSPVQIRTMQQTKPPIRIIAPGRVYRSDYDATHTPVFHQIEGLLIDRNVHMGHLKGYLVSFLKEFFELDHLPMRYRASYFPFTEPSAEVDIACSRQGGEIKIGEGSDWLEILGCGMVHPKVLENVGLDPTEYQGFAFGMGIERLAMLKYGLPDLRAFYENDKRWIQHYGFSFAHGLNGDFPA